MGRLFWFWYAVGFVLLVFFHVPEPLRFSNGLFLLLFALYALSLERSGEAGHSAWKLWGRAGAVFILTMALEIAGVSTGFVFGSYGYSETLGVAIAGVPAAVGFAWVGVVSVSVALASQKSRLIRALQAGVWAAALDLVLDPAAAAISLWTWGDSGMYYGIPAQNFAVWFATVFLLSFLYPVRGKTAEQPSRARFARLYAALAALFGAIALKEGLAGPALLAAAIAFAAEGRVWLESFRKKRGQRAAAPGGQEADV